VEKTFVFRKCRDGRLRLRVHHSSLPAKPVKWIWLIEDLAKVEALNISRGEAPNPGIKRMADATAYAQGRCAAHAIDLRCCQN
jgi:hypothetical protein